jgi:hypothetical protein
MASKFKSKRSSPPDENAIMEEASKWTPEKPNESWRSDVHVCSARGVGVEKESATSVSVTIRMRAGLVEGLRRRARKHRVGYQTLIKRWLEERLRREQVVEAAPAEIHVAARQELRASVTKLVASADVNANVRELEEDSALLRRVAYELEARARETRDSLWEFDVPRLRVAASFRSTDDVLVDANSTEKGR